LTPITGHPVGTELVRPGSAESLSKLTRFEFS
jgi:hypothetical protein